jgi:C-terminal processing protease CtpA/Prc
MIEGVDTLGVCGWVVDLRGNTGGNMWPMVAGIGPIVGEGVLGFFVDPDSIVKTWTYRSGSSRLDAGIITQATDPYELATPHPPVAVITDSLTASSGEATTIAFRGRPDSRSFGRPTWGVSTANGTFLLSDGAALILTVSTMADRTGQLYGEKVIPDQLVDGPRTGDPETDQPLAASMDWLREQPACSGWSPFLSTIFENPGRSP